MVANLVEGYALINMRVEERKSKRKFSKMVRNLFVSISLGQDGQ